VLAAPDRLRILDAQHVVASHARSYGKGEQIEDPAHLQALVAQKRAARQHRAGDRLTQAAPVRLASVLRSGETPHCWLGCQKEFHRSHSRWCQWSACRGSPASLAAIKSCRR
jgi:hypothetical protein